MKRRFFLPSETNHTLDFIGELLLFLSFKHSFKVIWWQGGIILGINFFFNQSLLLLMRNVFH